MEDSSSVTPFFGRNDEKNELLLIKAGFLLIVVLVDVVEVFDEDMESVESEGEISSVEFVLKLLTSSSSWS